MRLTKIGIFAAALTLLMTTFMHAALAVPASWDWQDATEPTWTDTVNSSGPMVWGEIYDTAAYGGGIWTGGRDADSHAALWRYDEATGNWTNEMPAGIADGDHRGISAFAVHGGKLYLTTDNSNNGLDSEMWVKDSAGAAWTKVTSYDALNIGDTFGMTTFGDDLCVSGDDSQFKVWCYNGTTWRNTNLTGPAAHSNNSSKLAVVGNKLYVDAYTAGNYYGIWSFNGTSWTKVETPFTDEEEDSENHEIAHYIKGLGSFDGKLIAVSKDYDYETTYVWQYNGSAWTQIGQDNYDGEQSNNYNYAEIGTFEGKLMIGSGGYGESAKVWQYNTDNDEFHQVSDDYFGLEPDNNQFVPNYVSNFTVSNGVLFAATSGSGEGDYFPQLWRSSPLETNGGSDNGGSDSETEAPLPNNGDLNNDGVVDSSQDHVVSFKSGVSDKYVVLEVSDECTISEVGMKKIGELGGRDSGYEYVNGLMDFDVNCGDPGFTATVSQYYYDVPKGELVLRKYMPTTNAFFTIANATTQSLTIAGHTVTKATYQVTDGGDLDVDGEANGVIVDPAGLASNSVGVPRTGLGGK